MNDVAETERIAASRARVPARAAAPAAALRVAYLANRYPSVSHTFIRREIAAVEAIGEVQVLRYSLQRASHGAVHEADRAEAARTRVVIDRGLPGILVATLQALARRPARFVAALALAVRVGWGSDRGLLRHFGYFAQACRLEAMLREDGAEHLHAHFGTQAAAVAMLCRELGGVPYSMTIHGPLELELARLLSLGEKVARAQFVVAITDFCRSQIWRQSPAAHHGKVHVVGCGVDAAFLESEPTAIAPAPRLLFIGRLSEHKAPGLLVEAAARLRRAGVTFELLFVGDGELRPAIEAAIAREGVADCVRILGFSDEPAVRRAIQSARAVVLPSFAEGLPVVLMEALALGRPVVATFIAGIPELVEHGRNGWLVPAGSVEALTAALREVLECPVARLEAMGRAGRARVRERHDAAKNGRTLSGLFVSAARRRRA